MYFHTALKKIYLYDNNYLNRVTNSKLPIFHTKLSKQFHMVENQWL